MEKRNSTSIVVFHPLVGIQQLNEMGSVIKNYFKFKFLTLNLKMYCLVTFIILGVYFFLT